ncbi:MAG: prolipoprotein diacylglyceryl transferase family protein [Anaerolineae bacterium]
MTGRDAKRGLAVAGRTGALTQLVAFRIGSEPVYTYSLYMAAGLSAAALWLAVEAQRRGWSAVEAFEMLVWALLPGLVCGRLAYVVATLEGEPLALSLLLHPWGEGVNLPLAVLGGGLGLGLCAALQRRSWFALLGAAAPALALAQTLGWLGAAIHGAHAGIVLRFSTWAPQLRDLYGAVGPRFPLQYLAAVLSLALWLVLAYRPLSDRRRLALYLLISGVGLALLDVGREGRQPVVVALSVEQAAWLLLALAGLALVAPGRRGPARALTAPLPH